MSQTDYSSLFLCGEIDGFFFLLISNMRSRKTGVSVEKDVLSLSVSLAFHQAQVFKVVNLKQLMVLSYYKNRNLLYFEWESQMVTNHISRQNWSCLSNAGYIEVVVRGSNDRNLKEQNQPRGGEIGATANKNYFMGEF